MIKKALAAAPIIVGFVFATGFYVGWKTTLRIVDSVIPRKEDKEGQHV